MSMRARSNKFQDVHFNSIEEFLEYLPQQELVIVEALRQLISSCIPQCKEKLSYNVPFYSRHSGICFIWPSAVKWGGHAQADGVRLGFQKGYLLNDEMSYLDKGTRKQVYCKDFKSMQQINNDLDLLKCFLFEAAAIDEQLAKNKKVPR